MRDGTDAWMASQLSSKAELLIVDDEKNIRSSLARALSFEGYTVNEAESGHEALSFLEQNAPDLMVLDMRMPGTNGVEVMEKARKMHPELLIIVLTGYASVDNAIAAIRAEAVDFLCKPVTVSELAEAVTRALEKQASQFQQQQQLAEILAQALELLSQGETVPYPSVRAEMSWPSLDPLYGLPKQKIIQAQPLQLDRQKRLVSLEENPSHQVQLTKGENAVLAVLMNHPNQPLSCQELVFLGWGDNLNTEDAKSIIRPYVFRLRRKLALELKTPRLIHTVRRRGYSFVPPT